MILEHTGQRKLKKVLIVGAGICGQLVAEEITQKLNGLMMEVIKGLEQHG